MTKVHVVIARSLEKKAEIEILPVQSASKAIQQLRNRTFTYWTLVIAVYLTISV
ncbi:hypothetical protein D3C87_1263610 [compost metagenome]